MFSSILFIIFLLLFFGHQHNCINSFCHCRLQFLPNVEEMWVLVGNSRSVEPIFISICMIKHGYRMASGKVSPAKLAHWYAFEPANLSAFRQNRSYAPPIEYTNWSYVQYGHHYYLHDNKNHTLYYSTQHHNPQVLQQYPHNSDLKHWKDEL